MTFCKSFPVSANNPLLENSSYMKFLSLEWSSGNLGQNLWNNVLVIFSFQQTSIWGDIQKKCPKKFYPSSVMIYPKFLTFVFIFKKFDVFYEKRFKQFYFWGKSDNDFQGANLLTQSKIIKQKSKIKIWNYSQL